MNDQDSTVLTAITNQVMLIKFNRPDRANAFNYEMNRELLQALKAAGRNDDVRCVLIQGEGQFFSSGQDIGEIDSSEPASYREHLMRTYNPIIRQIRNIGKPVVAALHGAVAGAALGIALACDFRVCAEDTKFSVGFLGIGLAPDSAISLLLPAMVGLGRAAELTYTNKPFRAEEALEWGVVSEVVPGEDLHKRAMARAMQLGQGPVETIALAKKAFNNAVLPNLDQVLDYEGYLQEIAGQGEEHREGIQAFLEKRAPKFNK